MEDNEQAVYDVTTIKLKMKYPTNYFELSTWELCPYSLKVQIAFEYKLLHYNDIEFAINRTSPINSLDQQRFKKANGNSLVPQLKVQYKNGLEESWLSDSTHMLKFLDSLYPNNSLFFAENIAFNCDICLFEDWVDESFYLPFTRLLFLNDNNFSKLSSKWLEGKTSIVDNLRMALYKREKTANLMQHFTKKEQALANAVKRFDQELLPIVADKLENSNNRGFSFIFGNDLTAADLSLYAFLKLILLFEESHLVTRRPVLLKYINAIEDIPLNKVQGSAKKGYTRQKLVLIGENKESI